jgi:urease accessory protein
MRRAIHTERAGKWPSDQACGTVTLSYDDRYRRRIKLTIESGEAVLLDLPRPVLLGHGDGLALDDGGWIEVHAAAEPLIEARVGTPALFARIAWHIGNRHLPAQFLNDRILLRPGRVTEEMLRRLGAELRVINAPFIPERGAYDDRASLSRHGEHVHEH